MNDSRITTMLMGMTERVTGGTKVITSDHALIHEGRGYVLDRLASSLASNGIAYAQVNIPDNIYVHLKTWDMWTDSGKAKLEIIEAPTVTNGTTALTPQNKRRVGTPRASVVSVYSDPTSISGGTTVETLYVGGGSTGANARGGTNGVDEEIVLKPNTKYLFKVTNLDSQARDIFLKLFWYEEDVA